MLAWMMMLGVAAAEPSAGDKITVEVKGVSFEMAYAPAGTFEMGSRKSDPDHRSDETIHVVTLTQGFYIGTTEVTQSQYVAVMKENLSEYSNCETCPVETVSWFDATSFLNTLSELHGLQPAYTISGETVTQVPNANGYRLPTEAEWEYAARAGQRLAYAGSDDVNAVAWYETNSGLETHPVGTKQANAWGLHDASGNVWEWTWDGYAIDYYQTGSGTDPQGPLTSKHRVIRSGSFNTPADATRAASRYNLRPTHRSHILGFRIVRNAE